MTFPTETRKLEAWHVYFQGGHHSKRQSVPDIETACKWLNELARRQLGDDTVSWNAQGLEVLTGDDELNEDHWEEWYDEDDNDIRHYSDALWAVTA